jgi:hypothetical protein
VQGIARMTARKALGVLVDEVYARRVSGSGRSSYQPTKCRRTDLSPPGARHCQLLPRPTGALRRRSCCDDHLDGVREEIVRKKSQLDERAWAEGRLSSRNR